MKNWPQKWKKALIWFSAYINFISFAIIGGYTIVKSDDEELKKETKTAFIVSLIFGGLSALMSLYSYIINLFEVRSQGEVTFYNKLSYLIGIARLVVFVVFIVLCFVENKKKEEKNYDNLYEQPQENQENQ